MAESKGKRIAFLFTNGYQVVLDSGLVSSRRPADLPAFNSKLVEAFGLSS